MSDEVRARFNSPPDQAVRRFVLAAPLVAGLSAAAYIRRWNGSAFVNTTETFDVYDGLGIFDADTGKKGYAIFMPDTGHWEVTQLEC